MWLLFPSFYSYHFNSLSIQLCIHFVFHSITAFSCPSPFLFLPAMTDHLLLSPFLPFPLLVVVFFIMGNLTLSSPSCSSLCVLPFYPSPPPRPFTLFQAQYLILYHALTKVYDKKSLLCYAQNASKNSQQGTFAVQFDALSSQWWRKHS